MVVKGNELPLPGKCWCCGACDRDCVHWGYDEDFVGVVMLCVNCVLEAASNFRRDEQVDKIANLEAQIKSLLEFLEQNRAELADLSNRNSAAISAGAQYRDMVSSQGAIAGGARKG